MSRPIKIVSISAEVSPYSKTGGLADVCRSLPKAIKRLGHDIIVITPFYGKSIDPKQYNLKLIYKNVKVYLNSSDNVIVNYWQGFLMDNLPIYFIENKKYFSAKKMLYNTDHENTRFLVFNIAALKLITLLKYPADIVHCHDWHTGLIPFYLKTDFRYSKNLQKAKTIFTIHNLAFQFGKNWWEAPLEKKDYGRKKIPHITDPNIEYVNFAKRAILSADIINTVSEQYRDEILTKNFGQDLHRILRNRKDKLFGIVNGIDYLAYNPENDPGLHKKYNHQKTNLKKDNKKFLQQKLGLSTEANTPLIALTSRVTFQKGFELVLKASQPLAKLDIQMIIMGDGEKNYITKIKKIQKKYPKKIRWLPFSGNENMETQIYAAADLFLLPSHHEPCGINQMIAMRYGCIPIVRRVGGLKDTVTNYSPATNKGNGFCFAEYNPFSLYGAVIRALENYRRKDAWQTLMIKVMLEANSWELPAKKYISLYHKAIKNNK